VKKIRVPKLPRGVDCLMTG